MNEKTLNEFLEKAKNGDTIAKAEIFRRIYPMLVQYFRTQLRHRHDSEFLAGKCMKSFFKNIDNVDSVLPYIHRTKVNYLRNALKSKWFKQGRLTVPIDKELHDYEGLTMQDSLASNSPSPLEDSIDHERQSDIESAIDALDPKSRKALRLRTQGFSYKEISVQLDIKKESVGPIIHRARNKLMENPMVRRHRDELKETIRRKKGFYR